MSHPGKRLTRHCQRLLCLAALAGSGIGCATYGMPVADPSAVLELQRGDVDVLDSARGDASSWSIFPFSLFGGTHERATLSALHTATENAFERAEADFILRPRTKVTYYNFLLFDYAQAEAIGRAVRLKSGTER